MGSAVYAGAMDPAGLRGVADRDGVSLGQALDESMRALSALRRRESGEAVAAYVEAHIEQGPRLEAAGLAIGAVTGIQGSEWFAVEVVGEEAHAGTAPLKQRKDALKSACSIVGALEALMADESDTVRFTVGRFEVFPGSPNTVPGRVFFTIDFRHPERASIDRLGGQIESVTQNNARGCEVKVTRTRKTDPTHFDASMVALVGRQAEALGYPSMQIFSGAGHDAQYLARLCPTGMIFVPCKGGVSHNEAESATPADLAKGARVLAACLADLAAR
jgi:N-carbamoyl-L-amino-acid hydrolase